MKKKIGLKNIKKFFRSSFIFLLSFGFNIKIFILAVCNYPRYITELYKFKRMGGIVNNNHKSLTDYKEQAGISKGHYFHQDLLVAKYIYKNKPDKHIDIGSRIDGFVAHVATFRSIEIIDIRPLKKSEHKNIKFIKKDLMFHKSIDEKITDSISCLHAIEHFGLGRYGDKLDPNGHIKGFNNIIKMLKKNGKLYISFPVGKRNEIHFNYERIFHPKDIFNWYDNKNDLVLERFDLINDDGDLYENININKQLNVIYGCGIYTFRKIL
jgi:hypothetical protein